MPARLDDHLADAAALLVAARRAAPTHRAVLAALSGIDGSGKGYVAARLQPPLEAAGVRTAVLNIDGWLNLPAVRFNPADPAGHFYRYAIRFDEMFRRLVMPLRDSRQVDMVMNYAEETATAFRPERIRLTDVDLILLEGIYLLKREFLAHYDTTFWIDCDFETALGRAIARAQEGLPPAETARAYHTIYFPAQEIHFRLDDPLRAAAMVVPNR